VRVRSDLRGVESQL